MSMREAPQLQPPYYQDKANLLQYLDSGGQQHPIRIAADWEKRRTHILASMQLVMGPLPDSSKRVPLEVQVLEEVKGPAYTQKKLTYAPELGDAVPAYLLIPHGLKRSVPAILCLHPTHELGKGRVVEGAHNRQYAKELAERGLIALAPDYPGFGDYKIDVYARGYESATMKGIWNHLRAVDLLQALPEVDGERIGAIGHSLGGHNAIFSAVFDPRIRAVVSSAGFNSFFKYYHGDLTGWSHKGYMPKIASTYGKDPAQMPFDFTEVIAALAPRPFFISAPLHDDNLEVSGVRDCIAAAKPVYELFGAQQNLVVVYPDAGHDFPPAERALAYAFLEHALK